MLLSKFYEENFLTTFSLRQGHWFQNIPVNNSCIRGVSCLHIADTPPHFFLSSQQFFIVTENNELGSGLEDLCYEEFWILDMRRLCNLIYYFIITFMPVILLKCVKFSGQENTQVSVYKTERYSWTLVHWDPKWLK